MEDEKRLHYLVCYDKDLRDHIAIEFEERKALEDYMAAREMNPKQTQQTSLIAYEDSDYDESSSYLFYIGGVKVLCTGCCDMSVEDDYLYKEPTYIKGSVGNGIGVYFPHLRLCPSMEGFVEPMKHLLSLLWHRRNPEDDSIHYSRSFMTDLIEHVSNESMERFRIVQSRFMTDSLYAPLGKGRKQDVPTAVKNAYANAIRSRYGGFINGIYPVNTERFWSFRSLADRFGDNNHGYPPLDIPPRAMMQLMEFYQDKEHDSYDGYPDRLLKTEDYLLIEPFKASGVYIARHWGDDNELD